MTDSTDQTQAPSRDRFLQDFATVSAGYIAGHGILRLFAGLLIGLGDQPRATLIERWIPLWNALGFFVLAWGVYSFLRRLDRRPTYDLPLPTTRPGHLSPPTTAPPMSASPLATAPLPNDWKTQLKALQKKKDVGALVDFLAMLSKSLPKERAERLDRHLGRWYTKHFQRMMLSGRAAESADGVERVAAYYADSEEFGYFREILPVVRQCAELKQSIAEEE